MRGGACRFTYWCGIKVSRRRICGPQVAKQTKGGAGEGMEGHRRRSLSGQRTDVEKITSVEDFRFDGRVT
jgi:hypothetical protein